MPGLALALLIALTCLCDVARAHDLTPQASDADAPEEAAQVDLRFALSPLAFQAAVSQSWFGSAARVEYAPLPFAEIALDGRVAWLNANHGSELHSYALRAGLTFHLVQSVAPKALYGTVYAADTAAVGGGGIGSDQDLQVPASERLRTGLSAPHDVDTTLEASMRTAHSLRLGAAYVHLLERARPDASAVSSNRLPVAHIGYSHTTYWNIPQRVTGKHEQGFRRYYGDLLLTLPSAISAKPDVTPDGQRISIQPVGARLGMQGTLGGLLTGAPFLGFAYDLELGVYPGRGGVEGYLFLALGMALEAATR
jgi:hypothetical protein